MKRFALIGVFLVALAAITGCGDDEPIDIAKKKAEASGKQFDPYIPPPGNTEQRNYNEAQRIYNDPATILWCSAFPESSTAPIVTVPIAGKLTSSTTTAFRPEDVINNDSSGSGVAVTSRSVDGLYHPSPPAYRFGFTPGGQLVDFFSMPTICTTQPLEFQRQSVTVQVASDLDAASKRAEQALRVGDEQRAQAILEGAAG
jgi:hypothetical protein